MKAWFTNYKMRKIKQNFAKQFSNPGVALGLFIGCIAVVVSHHDTYIPLKTSKDLTFKLVGFTSAKQCQMDIILNNMALITSGKKTLVRIFTFGPCILREEMESYTSKQIHPGSCLFQRLFQKPGAQSVPALFRDFFKLNN